MEYIPFIRFTDETLEPTSNKLWAAVLGDTIVHPERFGAVFMEQQTLEGEEAGGS
jgi:hypothetical protein